MAYATAAEVKARAGKVGDAWTKSGARRPNEEDLDAFLGQVADEIDGRIGALGHTTPATDRAAAALKGTNLDGALMLALEATFPGEIPADVKGLHEGAKTRYTRSLALLDKGKHPALSLLEATEPGVAGASSLWSNEPTYGEEPEPSGSDRNVNLRPGFFRGQPL